MNLKGVRKHIYTHTLQLSVLNAVGNGSNGNGFCIHTETPSTLRPSSQSPTQMNQLNKNPHTVLFSFWKFSSTEIIIIIIKVKCDFSWLFSKKCTQSALNVMLVTFLYYGQKFCKSSEKCMKTIKIKSNCQK